MIEAARDQRIIITEDKDFVDRWQAAGFATKNIIRHRSAAPAPGYHAIPNRDASDRGTPRDARVVGAPGTMCA
jgi:hypothetical protein